MEKIDVCPNCGHVFEFIELHFLNRINGICPECKRKCRPVSVTPEEYKNMAFENKPPERRGRLDQKTRLFAGAACIMLILLFLMEDWVGKICWIISIGIMVVFYLIDRARAQKENEE
jgi:hypothetical protein